MISMTHPRLYSSLWIVALSIFSLSADEPTLRPYQEIEGQRFWHSGNTSKYFKQESKKLHAEKKPPARRAILKQLEERSSCPISLPATPVPQQAINIYQKIAEATVLIMTHDGKNGDRYGTGFFIAPGVIVSNWHVVDTEIDFPMIAAMTYDGTLLTITEGLAGNEAEDLVVLKADTAGKTFPHLALAPSLPNPGTALWQCGHTHTAYWTFTDGIINRYCMEPFNVDDKKPKIDHAVIDISHKVSAGSSGSALINARGELVGIYHHRRWYNQTEKNFVAPKNNKIDEAKRPHIEDRVVLFERNLAIPVNALRAMITRQP
jgi:S1-C subfamily serine protease